MKAYSKIALLFCASALVAAPSGAGEVFTYTFRPGSMVPISDRLDGSVTFTGMGMTMNGTFDLAVESSLRVLSVGQDGSAEMEAVLTRLKGGIQFPLTGAMRLDTNSGAQADPRLAKAEEEAKSLVGQKLIFNLDSHGNVLKARLAAAPPAGSEPAGMAEGVKGLAQIFFLNLPDPFPTVGRSWDPFLGTKAGVNASLVFEKKQKGTAFFRFKSEADVGAAVEKTVLPEGLPNSEAAQGFMKGMSGRVSALGELSYSVKDGTPAGGSGKVSGSISFKQSQDPASPASNLDFLIHWTRSRVLLAKP